MRKRTGLLGALGAIAVGVTIGAVSGSASMAQVALQSEQPAPNLEELCRVILSTRSTREFQATPVALNAYNNTSDQCHEIARAHWLRLLEPGVQTGDLGGGYTFG